MRNYLGIILVTISMLRPGDTGYCGTLNLDKDSYKAGENALLTYTPFNIYPKREWVRGQATLERLNITSSSKYKESNQGNVSRLTINKIDKADAGNYRVYCSPGYTDPVNLTVYSNDLNCGHIEFREPRVYRGEPAFLIYTPIDVNAPVHWYKSGSVASVLLYPNETSRSSRKYTESKTDEGFTLKISDTKSTDAGSYVVLCDRSWSPRTELQVIEPVLPSDPEFQDVEEIFECRKKCLPARLNVTMNVTCFVRGGSKQVELKLFKSGELLSVTQRELQNKTFIIMYSFMPTRDDIVFDTVFTCTVKNPALRVEKTVSTKLYIKVDPESIEIKHQLVKENETRTVQCTTINGRPPTRSLFYLNGSQQHSVNITKTICSGYTYNVTTTLWKQFTRQDNNASIYCCTDISHRVCSATGYLNITFPPKSVVLSERSKNSKENGDTVLELKCDVDESNPKSYVDWKGVKNLTRQCLGEKHIYHSATHGWTYTTSWEFNLTKKDRGREITCQVKNFEFADLELQTSLKPEITYSPVITAPENEIKTVYIGDDVLLSCYVDSNPPSEITWSNKDNKLKESNGENKLDLRLVNVTIEQSQTYTCTASNGIGEKKSRDITLSVKVPSEKTYKQPSSEASSAPLVLPVIGGAAVLIIAVVAGVVFLTLWKKRNDEAPKRKRTHRIEDEPKHESVNPVRNEHLHNDMPASNEKEVENAPEYACVIPKANRKHGTDPLKSEEAPEYAGVIPKANRKPGTDQLKSEDTSEYACVIPKAERKHGTDQRNSEDPKSQGDTLVYAELDLNFDPGLAARRPLTEQYEPTEYVNIDFSKTGTVKIDTGEIETGTVKIEHDEMATQSVKREDKDV